MLNDFKTQLKEIIDTIKKIVPTNENNDTITIRKWEYDIQRTSAINATELLNEAIHEASCANSRVKELQHENLELKEKNKDLTELIDILRQLIQNLSPDDHVLNHVTELLKKVVTDE